MAQKLKSPIVMQLELTQSCNHKCVHCYNYWRPEEGLARKSTSQEVGKLHRIADSIIDAEVFAVILSGGEPFLIGRENLESLIDKYQSANVKVSVNSNITTLRPDDCYMLADHRVQVLTSVLSDERTDFDFRSQRPGSYQRFVAAARLLEYTGVRAGANFVVDSKRVDKVYATGKLVAELGFKGFYATRICPPHTASFGGNNVSLDRDAIGSLLDQLLAVKKDFGLNIGTLNALPYCCVPNPENYQEIFNRSCAAGLTSGGCDVNGNVRGCQHFNFDYGNLVDEPLTSIWERVPVWKTSHPAKECTGCAYKQKCGGGCRESALNGSGDMWGRDQLQTSPISKRWESLQRDAPQAIKFRQNLMMRTEEFGGIVFADSSRYAMVDHFTLYLAANTHNRPVVTQQDACEIGFGLPYVTPAYIRASFSGLVNNRVADEVK